MQMENLVCGDISKYCFDYTDGKWSVNTSGGILRLLHQGIKLYLARQEKITEITFDADKKIVELFVSNPVIEKTPRKADMSDDESFFNELREKIEEIVLIGCGVTLTPNSDRTKFSAV